MNKKRIKAFIIGAAVCICAAIIVYAVTKALKSVKNTFTPSSVSIDIYENDRKQNDNNTVTLTADGDNLTADKKVEIANSSSNSNQEIFVRVCIIPKFINTANSSYQIYIPHSDFPTNITGNAYTQGNVTFTLANNWSENWFYQNGYFYYKKPVAKGQKTAALLSSIIIPSQKYEAYLSNGADLKVTVLADAIQSVGGAVENRWRTAVLNSNDAERPAEDNTSAALAIFERKDILTSDSALTAPVVLTNYMIERILNTAVTVDVTTIYQNNPIPIGGELFDTDTPADNAPASENSESNADSPYQAKGEQTS